MTYGYAESHLAQQPLQNAYPRGKVASPRMCLQRLFTSCWKGQSQDRGWHE